MEEERRDRKKILEESEKMKAMHRSILDLKDLSEKMNSHIKKDLSYIDSMVEKGYKDSGKVSTIIKRLNDLKRDTFTFTLIITVVILSVLLFFGLLFR